MQKKPNGSFVSLRSWWTSRGGKKATSFGFTTTSRLPVTSLPSPRAPMMMWECTCRSRLVCPPASTSK